MLTFDLKQFKQFATSSARCNSISDFNLHLALPNCINFLPYATLSAGLTDCLPARLIDRPPQLSIIACCNVYAKLCALALLFI